LDPQAQASDTQTDVRLDYVGSLQNAAIVVSRLHRGEKRLIFCDSRTRVEELGNELRQLGVSTFLSHSSLSAEERRSAEEAFAQAKDCVIVATSTLELGIDVGSLDRVIQIDAPYSVASFLQRLGRTGRRRGALRNFLFLATNDNALLRAGAIISLWEARFVEPVLPPKRPLHLFAQQLMALALQEQGIGIQDWRRWIARLPAFSQISDSDIDVVIGHLLERTILFSDGARLSFGTRAKTFTVDGTSSNLFRFSHRRLCLQFCTAEKNLAPFIRSRFSDTAPTIRQFCRLEAEAGRLHRWNGRSELPTSFPRTRRERANG